MAPLKTQLEKGLISMLKIQPLTIDIYHRTVSQWTSQLENLGENNIPFRGYLIYLGFIQQGLSSKSKTDINYYCVIDGSHILAVFEMSHALPDTGDHYLKILSVRTAPKFDTRAPDEPNNTLLDRKNEISRLYTQIIFDVLSMAKSKQPKPARKVKIYGNNQCGAEFFSHLISVAVKIGLPDKSGYNFNRYGNWLEIDLCKNVISMPTTKIADM